MARKTYSDEFRRDAVELYRSTPGATVVGIAGDLGIMDATLSTWLKAAGVPVRSRHPGDDDESPPAGETPVQELARLRARVTE
ncbi:transposase, partial [Modestobacter sp. DSM 44400]